MKKMKSNNSSRLSLKRIRSLRDIELAKAKLDVEIVKTEETIRYSYRHLINRLTFRNMASSLIQEVSTHSNLISKAISASKSFFEKRKKKKKEKTHKEEVPIEPEETRENQTKSNAL